MKRMRKSFFLLLFVTLLLGCVPTRDNLPPGYQFSSQSVEGVAVFTITCNIMNGDMTLHLKSDSTSQLYPVSVNCSKPTDNAPARQLKMINLSPGLYYIEGYSIFLSGIGVALVSKDFDKVYFKVKPGVVSYLGSFEFTKGYSNHSVLQDYNDHARDIPWFRKTAVGVAKNTRVEVEEPYRLVEKMKED